MLSIPISIVTFKNHAVVLILSHLSVAFKMIFSKSCATCKCNSYMQLNLRHCKRMSDESIILELITLILYRNIVQRNRYCTYCTCNKEKFIIQQTKNNQDFFNHLRGGGTSMKQLN